MSFKHVRITSDFTEVVWNEIVRRMKRPDFNPARFHPSRDLYVGCSSGRVREALRRLATRGLVVARGTSHWAVNES